MKRLESEADKRYEGSNEQVIDSSKLLLQTNFNQKHKIRAYFPSKLNKKVQIAFNRPSADLGLIS